MFLSCSCVLKNGVFTWTWCSYERRVHANGARFRRSYTRLGSTDL